MVKKSPKRSNILNIKWSGFSVQIFFIIILPLSVLLLGVTFGSLILHQEAMRRLVGDRDERTARSIASALSEQLNHRASAVQNLALRISDQISPDEILASVDFLHPDFDLGLAIIDLDGSLLATNGNTELWENLGDEIGIQIRNELEEAGSEPKFSSPLSHPGEDGYLVLVMVKLTPQTPTAVGAFSVTTLARQTLAGIMASNEQASTFLVDGDGQVLFQTGSLRISEPPREHPGVREALRGESGTTYLSMNESEHVIAFNPVIPTGWALVIEEPWDAVASPLLRYTGSGSLVLVPVLIFTLAALWFGARRIIQPLKELETRSAALAWGDYQAVEYPVGGIAEIGNLQQTLIHLAHKVQSAQQGLRDYIGAITTGQEEERLRLARELHDDTLQSLIALNQKVQITARSPQDKDTVDALAEIQKLIDQTIQDLRRLTRALRPLYLEDLGLVAALDMLARETSQSNDIPVHFNSQGVEQRLPGPEEIAIYRMAQEGLSNITRHAQANQATLNLTFNSDSVVLLISDNGKGFDVPESPAEFAPHGHFGLLGIQERAELIGARLEIQSSPGEGTKLKVSIPVREKDKSKSL